MVCDGVALPCQRQTPLMVRLPIENSSDWHSLRCAHSLPFPPSWISSAAIAFRFTHRKIPVVFSTHNLPPDISNGPEGSIRISRGLAHPAPSIGRGTVQEDPQSVE